jgi:hypothetical protein
MLILVLFNEQHQDIKLIAFGGIRFGTPQLINARPPDFCAGGRLIFKPHLFRV